MKYLITILAIMSINFMASAQQMFDEYSSIVKYVSENMADGQLYGKEKFKSIIWEEETDSLNANVSFVGTNGITYLCYFNNGLKSGSTIYKYITIIKEDNKEEYNQTVSGIENHYHKSNDSTWYYFKQQQRIKVVLEYEEKLKSYTFIHSIVPNNYELENISPERIFVSIQDIRNEISKLDMNLVTVNWVDKTEKWNARVEIKNKDGKKDIFHEFINGLSDSAFVVITKLTIADRDYASLFKRQVVNNTNFYNNNNVRSYQKDGYTILVNWLYWSDKQIDNITFYISE